MSKYCWIGLIALALAGCGRQQHSAIVEHAQKAGAGELSTASTQSMAAWLGQHKAVSREIDALCGPKRQSAPANWGDTTEGRLCAAARTVAFFNSAPAKGDDRTFRPGIH